MNRRYLILTAGYGEGHNSAAKALKAEAEKRGDVATVRDLCCECFPLLFEWTRQLYLKITHSYPDLWRIFFDLTDRMDMEVGGGSGLRRMVDALSALIVEVKPDAVLCTFPIYASCMDELRRESVVSLPPYLLVITDSLKISRAWLSSSPNLRLVTDERTRRELLNGYGLAEDSVQVTGFPTADDTELSPVKSWSEGEPFRVLYVPQKNATETKAEVMAMLRAHPDVCVTIVMGKRTDVLPMEHFQEIGQDRLIVLGWVENMPRLMAEHHVYVGKAGGACVHEAYAAALPVLVNYLLPGQEEGNLELLESEGCGCLAETPAELVALMKHLLYHRGALWMKMQHAMRRANRKNGSARCLDWAESICGK